MIDVSLHNEWTSGGAESPLLRSLDDAVHPLRGRVQDIGGDLALRLPE